MVQPPVLLFDADTIALLTLVKVLPTKVEVIAQDLAYSIGTDGIGSLHMTQGDCVTSFTAAEGELAPLIQSLTELGWKVSD